jgi:hypothetical protein
MSGGVMRREVPVDEDGWRIRGRGPELVVDPRPAILIEAAREREKKLEEMRRKEWLRKRST